MASAKPGLRPFLSDDAALCAAIYEASVTDLTGDEYTEAQQEAWVAAMEDEETFAKRLGSQLTLLATLGDSVVGFASLKGNELIDMLYVHPAAVGQGVGSALCDALEKLATARGATKIVAEVSDTAHRFFNHRGYEDWRRNSVPLGDEWLGNTTMRKTLAGPAAQGTRQ